MNETLKGWLAAYLNRYLMRREYLEVLAYQQHPTRLRSVLEPEQLTLVVFDMSNAQITGSHERATELFQAMVTRVALRRPGVELQFVQLQDHLLALGLYCNPQDRHVLVSGTVQRYVNDLQGVHDDVPPIVYALGSPLEAAYALSYFNRVRGGALSQLEDMASFSLARLLYEIVVCRLRQDALMDDIWCLSQATADRSWSRWTEVGDELERFPALREVTEHLDPFVIRGIARLPEAEIMPAMYGQLQHAVREQLDRFLHLVAHPPDNVFEERETYFQLCALVAVIVGNQILCHGEPQAF